MAYLNKPKPKPRKVARPKRRPHGIGGEENGGPKVPLGAAMAALFITALVFGKRMR